MLQLVESLYCRAVVGFRYPFQSVRSTLERATSEARAILYSPLVNFLSLFLFFRHCLFNLNFNFLTVATFHFFAERAQNHTF